MDHLWNEHFALLNICMGVFFFLNGVRCLFFLVRVLCLVFAECSYVLERQVLASHVTRGTFPSRAGGHRVRAGVETSNHLTR